MHPARILLGITSLALFAFATPAQSISFTTTFANNNGFSGNMFDLNVLAADGIALESLELNLNAGDWDVELYSRSGTYAGHENSSAGWTLRGSISNLTSAGSGSGTAWDIADFVLNGGASALYVIVTNGSALQYTNGTTEGALFASDANLEFFEGVGTGAAFGTQTFRPRVWNGTIEYSVVVPEPTTALLMGLGLVGLASIGRRESGEAQA